VSLNWHKQVESSKNPGISALPFLDRKSCLSALAIPHYDIFIPSLPSFVSSMFTIQELKIFPFLLQKIHSQQSYENT
jgi:hypothetical protein